MRRKTKKPKQTNEASAFADGPVLFYGGWALLVLAVYVGGLESGIPALGPAALFVYLTTVAMRLTQVNAEEHGAVTPATKKVKAAENVYRAGIAFALVTLPLILSPAATPADALAGAVTVAGTGIVGTVIGKRHQPWEPGVSQLGIAFVARERLGKPRFAVISAAAVIVGGALTAFTSLGALAGVLVFAAAAVPKRDKAARDGMTQVGVERAGSGWLEGGDWTVPLRENKRIPIRRIEFTSDGGLALLEVPLPERLSKKAQAEREADIVDRFDQWGLFAVDWNTGDERSVTIKRVDPLPQGVAYDGRGAVDGARVWLGKGLGTHVHKKNKVLDGVGVGDVFDFHWDLRTEPHGLAVGTTGSGKSQTVQLVMAQLALAGWRLVLIDPKRIEFSPWVGRPGVLKVATQLEDQVEALVMAEAEMMRRYEMFEAVGVNHIDKLPADQRDPRILVVVDEVFELLSPKKSRSDEAKAINDLKAEADNAIGSILRLGRAAGVHLMLAAQRADRPILSGEYQNNIAFKVIHGAPETIERTMIGVDDTEAEPGIPGRAVARTLALPWSELQVAYIDLEKDLDLYLPIGGVPRPVVASVSAGAADSIGSDQPALIAEARGQTNAVGDQVAAPRHERKQHKGRRVEPLPHGEAEKRLVALIGLAATKVAIAALKAQIWHQQQLRAHNIDEELIPGHYVFVGPPGTGKTTVARILGSLLRDLGVLSSGHVIEVTPSALKGTHVGESGEMTNTAFDDAQGGLLFLDEAYGVRAGIDVFADEIRNELMVRAENDRPTMSVVLAGYEPDMDDLLNSNAGLRSRFETRIPFPAYTVPELMQIAIAMFADKRRTLGEGAGDALTTGLAAQDLASPDWGNARSVRSIVERSVAAAAARLQANAVGGPVTAEALLMIEREDVLTAMTQPNAETNAAEPVDSLDSWLNDVEAV